MLSRDKCLESKVGIFTAKGKRPYQEDRAACAKVYVEGIDRLPMNVQSALLRDHFKQMQDEYGNRENVGSTACVVTSWIETVCEEGHDVNRLRIVAASLGDSRVELIVINSFNNRFKIFEDLTATHKPDDPDELQRITAAGGFVKKGRLKGRLAMSRAFGDIEYDAIGLSHVPDIEFYDYKLSAGDVAYIVVVSDGLDDVEDEIYYKAIKKLHYLRFAPVIQLTLIGRYLVESALNLYRSSDNCTAVVYRVCKEPLSAAVFDGHGGADVAELLKKHFYPSLGQRIQSALQIRNELSPAITVASGDDSDEFFSDESDVSRASTSSYGSASLTLFACSSTDVSLSTSSYVESHANCSTNSK